ncbi:hypothetical protein NE237_000942 [Protea cynaroides]|uniref:Uncharacterized protein n=1 Tax=Protea cynaroides TaxID=273540 RepID=A0A9Q0KSF2_9MAGN|nr:hypothetical protein NE237_000942 [Protea cynaroides]
MMDDRMKWVADEILHRYIHDYMLKKNLHTAALTFRTEANIPNEPVAIDSPGGGFLLDWWSLFYDMYSSCWQAKELSHEIALKANQVMDINQESILQQYQMNQRRLGWLPTEADFTLAAKIYEERLRNSSSKTLRPNIQHADSRNMFRKSMVQNLGNVQHQNFAETQKHSLRDGRQAVDLSLSNRTETTLHGVPNIMIPISGPSEAELGKLVINSMPFIGRPLAGIDQIPPGLGKQVLKSDLQTPIQQQFQMLTAQQREQLIAQSLSYTAPNLVSFLSGTSADLDLQRLMLLKAGLNVKDEYMSSSVNSLQSISSSTEAVSKTVSTVPKDKDGRHDMAESSSNANVESFLSNDTDIDDLRGIPFSTLLQSSTACNRIVPKGLPFELVCSRKSSETKVLCCHFSSDGKLLASAGHDKKVVLWNLDTFKFKRSLKDHSLLITDVRFRRSSSILATSSSDKTIRIWDANYLRHSLYKLLGHSEQVMSLDFHPEKEDLLCSCDNNEILLWNVNHRKCIRVSKGGVTQIRFQSQVGQLLAAASGNTINIRDVETGSVLFNLEGHVKRVQSICWDTTGKYIASVSEDCVRVWSALSGGECVHKLCSNDKKFQSCTFHSRGSLLLVIGGYKSLELWNPMSTCKTNTYPAHGGLITALADSPSTRMVATTSHDGYVKLWR